jgi:hypothetical protein
MYPFNANFKTVIECQEVLDFPQYTTQVKFQHRDIDQQEYPKLSCIWAVWMFGYKLMTAVNTFDFPSIVLFDFYLWLRWNVLNCGGFTIFRFLYFRTTTIFALVGNYIDCEAKDGAQL